MATGAELLLDTSAALAFLLRSHAAHQSTYDAVRDRRLGLAGHAVFETFAVITRLPEPSRVSPATAHRLLQHTYPRARYLSADRAGRLVAELAEANITGGAVHDALVAAVAVEHRRQLATRDRRALGTYAAAGADVVLLE
ncbi:MAG TPA: PIN domain-containing protein [Marmoricola sp.]|nr:PIN domain-containing protein [Marmoricola sp.]